MRSKKLLLVSLVIVLAVAAGCVRVRFIEPKGAKVTMQESGLNWTEPQEIPVSPEDARKFPEYSSRKIRIMLPDGYTIYGRMDLKGKEYFGQYGAIPICLTQAEVIDPIVKEDKVITYVIYEPWIGGKKPERERFKGILEHVGTCVSMFGTLWLGESKDEKGTAEDAQAKAVEERGEKVLGMYGDEPERGHVGGPTTATIVGVGDDPIKAAEEKGKILAILRLGTRKRSKW